MEDNKVDCEVVGLHDLLYKAIIFPDEMKVQEPMEKQENE